jgi:flagellar protein FliS
MNETEFYEETAVATQNKGRLVVMLYDGAIRFLKQALRALQAGDLEAKGQNIVRAREIIFELNTVLDMDAGQELAQNLRKLYNFMNKHLTQASFSNDPQMIREVIVLMEQLNQGWRAIAV